MVNYLFLLVSFFMFWVSMLVFTLILFRQKVKDHTYKMIVCSLIMTHVSIASHLLQNYSLPNFVIIFQPICFILSYYYIFRIQFHHTLAVTMAVYTVNFIAESSLYLIYSRFQLDKFLEVAQAGEVFPIFYLLTINLLLSMALYKSRFGFTFVPFRKNANHMLSDVKKITYFIVPAALLVVVFATSTFFFLHKIALIGLTSISTFMILLFHHFYTREIED